MYFTTVKKMIKQELAPLLDTPMENDWYQVFVFYAVSAADDN